MSNWTLFSNHGHVLFCLSRDTEARLRDVATDVGITERAVQKIVRDLQDGGMISVTKSGRRNRYRIHKKQTLRHQLEASCTIRDLIKVVNKDSKTESYETGSVGKARKPRKKQEQGPVATGLGAANRPASEKSAPTKRAPVKTESEEQELPHSIEKQQGSLF